MPLVVPGVTVDNLGDSKTQEWMSKLMGKTLTDSESSATAFAKRDLPPKTRVIQPGQMVSKDHEPGRLNVTLNADGTVAGVYHG